VVQTAPLFCCSLHVRNGCSLQDPLVCLGTDSVQAQLKLPAQLSAQLLHCTVLWLHMLCAGMTAACTMCPLQGMLANIPVHFLLVQGLGQLAGFEGFCLA
jgi:hypothetical protein